MYQLKFRLKNDNLEFLDSVEAIEYFETYLLDAVENLNIESVITQEDEINFQNYFTLHSPIAELDSNRLILLVGEFLKIIQKEVCLISVSYSENMRSEYDIFENQDYIMTYCYDEKMGQVDYSEQSMTDIYEDKNLPRRWIVEYFFNKEIDLNELKLNDSLEKFLEEIIETFSRVKFYVK